MPLVPPELTLTQLAELVERAAVREMHKRKWLTLRDMAHVTTVAAEAHKAVLKVQNLLDAIDNGELDER